nr:thiamine-phosphate kinase [Natronocella acetinitrilica]
MIARYFSELGFRREDVALGVGDDSALVDPPPGQRLAICTDTLVSGIHFPEDAPAESVGHKALAVNLSDLAAMGAEPAWATLSLTLPEPDEDWIAPFARGLGDLARYHRMSVVGGDLSRGPLSITVQAIGLVPPGRALRRSRASVGDAVLVSGTLGDAALGLRLWRRRAVSVASDASWLMERLHRPTARVSLGMALRDVATACIDVSDGLAADLDHLLAASGVGAVVDVDRLPLSDAGLRFGGGRSHWRTALTGGDDYELCFTVPRQRLHAVDAVASRVGVQLTRIGTVQPGKGLQLVRSDRTPVRLTDTGYRHFRN